LRVSGENVDVEEDETERIDRLGLKAVRRRRREVDAEVVRSGVKDWKRFWRVGEDMVIELGIVVEGGECDVAVVVFTFDREVE
jgi:hypothetical protein